jgi:hypothetical protein
LTSKRKVRATSVANRRYFNLLTYNLLTRLSLSNKHYTGRPVHLNCMMSKPFDPYDPKLTPLRLVNFIKMRSLPGKSVGNCNVNTPIDELRALAQRYCDPRKFLFLRHGAQRSECYTHTDNKWIYVNYNSQRQEDQDPNSRMLGPPRDPNSRMLGPPCRG